jgi:hypothetical protein
MQQEVLGLTQAGILANKCLRRKLVPFGYNESTHTPGLLHHKTRPIPFTLVVHDVKYVHKDNVDHLVTSIRKDYLLTKTWTGDLYCGIQLGWDYSNQMVDISKPGYRGNKLLI